MSGTIILIEDNAQNRYLTTFLLEKHGYQVVSAPDAKAALRVTAEVCAQRRPICILLDIQLPGMDGYAVARALRSQHSFAELPIIAVTSYAMVGDREKALAAGCNSYIEKPIDPDTFVSQVEAIVASALDPSPR
jgi:two-component system cell cycle response regulator DivK